VTNCTFSGNSADCGGGMCNWSSSPTVTNCTFSGNVAQGYWNAVGGGMYNVSSSPTVTNCTFSGNSAENGGGMSNRFGGSNPTVTNCVLWGNRPDEIADVDGAATIVGYSDVQGGWPGEGNIDGDPLFVDPDGPDNDPNTFEDNDYRLSPGSPCIDAGCNWSVPSDSTDLDADGDTSEITPLDLDGEGRFFDDPDTADIGCGNPPIVDMGAYEFGDTGPQPCFGDLDDDGDVDLSDLAVLLAHYGETETCDGDLNCDGNVDLTDLSALLGVYGTSCD
jgi:hypothetical protein